MLEFYKVAISFLNGVQSVTESERVTWPVIYNLVSAVTSAYLKNVFAHFTRVIRLTSLLSVTPLFDFEN